MDYVSGCVGKRRSRLRRYFQSLDVINYYSSRCSAEMIRYPHPTPISFSSNFGRTAVGGTCLPVPPWLRYCEQYFVIVLCSETV